MSTRYLLSSSDYVAKEPQTGECIERVVLLWTLTPAERDAYLANEAIKLLTANNWVLLEIARTRSSLILFAVKQAYHARYKKSLEEDVAYHTSGDILQDPLQLLVPLVCSFRYEGDEVNMTLAKKEAKIMCEAISDKKHNDEELIRILSIRSNHYNNSHW
ncbi:hypothetical protein Dsin_016731 [Dipteronia sinensis]|uniref:Uncharacterized protein n=1 Tax=Dipteronia sinensis TaxID=43782 RepID=A0AAE0ADM7_9ROSI|nr:hypothetical protein Dsin_016731 [Dipteronia sinensis]